mmetsp:Transcript_29902/g.30413  ORF Transcript_29902/g.30413 Transcript_29902/m.30413 type:complete len:91 (-) Transcript_29902:2988-3260(-)
MMESKKDDVPTESMYAKAASFLFVDDGGKMTVLDFRNKLVKLKSIIQQSVVAKGSWWTNNLRKKYHLPQSFYNNLLLQYWLLLKPVVLLI